VFAEEGRGGSAPNPTKGDGPNSNNIKALKRKAANYA